MKDRFRNILAVYDDAIGSDDVLERAIVLARASGAQLTVAKPLGVHPESFAMVAEANRRLKRIVPSITQQGVKVVSAEVLIGTPYVELSRQVLQQDHDLVIASADASRGIKDIFRGTTAINLMRKCPCPVWIVKPRQAMRDSLMVAVDAPADQPADPLDNKLLDLAAALARTYNARLHVVHSWEVERRNEAEMLRSEIRDTTKRAILNKHEVMHRDALERMLAPYRNSQVEIEMHLPRGARQTNIITLANGLDVSLVVMGMAGRVGISGLMMGNSSEIVLDAVRCGVLAVKPDGFRTPVSIPQAEMDVTRLAMGSH